ncbi:hypothetical protein KFL_000780200 [Klebsormidium nitens]|uniref:Uncharacterized protein n=1 Tax=Klebsormidium nitens TaxID=105231 RepID=A0A1Y1HZS5_KLENI|nr:hypothetical protein KFL_000780200 [Klebsormidium nitens]|eukprot:GAQ81358.1 hypothetical protein KFL_000780200 [Klebsormidium nitens]
MVQRGTPESKADWWSLSRSSADSLGRERVGARTGVRSAEIGLKQPAKTHSAAQLDRRGTVGKRVAGARQSSGEVSSASAKRSGGRFRPPDVDEQEPFRSANSSPGGRLSSHESAELQTEEPCSKRRRGGPVWPGDPPPQSETPFPADAPECGPLTKPSGFRRRRGGSPRFPVAADTPWNGMPERRNGAEAWRLQDISDEKSPVETTGVLGDRRAPSGRFDRSELCLRRDAPVSASWPVELQFGTGSEYPVLEERSGTNAAVSGAEAPCKPGYREIYPLPKDGVNESHRGFDELNAAVNGPNAGVNTPNHGADDPDGGLDDLTSSITALLTDHMHALVDAQEAQLAGTADSGRCPVELSPGQVAKILERQGQMRAALDYFRTLTGSEPTVLSPSTGENYSSTGQPSLNGTQSYAPEPACPEKWGAVGGIKSGLRERVTGPETRFGGESPSPYTGTTRSSGLAVTPNGWVEPVQGPLFVPLVGRFPPDALAEPPKDTWQLTETGEWGEWNAQGHVEGPWDPFGALLSVSRSE